MASQTVCGKSWIQYFSPLRLDVNLDKHLASRFEAMSETSSLNQNRNCVLGLKIYLCLSEVPRYIFVLDVREPSPRRRIVLRKTPVGTLPQHPLLLVQFLEEFPGE